MRGALLVLLLARPVPAAVSSEAWPLTPEESARLGAEQAQACAQVEALLAKVEAHRRALKSSSDPDEVLARWSEDVDAMRPHIQQIHALGKRHSVALGETDLFLIMTTLGKKPSKNETVQEVTPEYQAINARNKEMAGRAGKFQDRFSDAYGRLDEERKLRARRIEHEAENRLLLRVVGGGAAVLLVLTLWAARRYRRA